MTQMCRNLGGERNTLEKILLRSLNATEAANMNPIWS